MTQTSSSAVAPRGRVPAIGDEVTVTGTVAEYYDMTELTDVSAFSIVSSGNPVTPAVLASNEVAQEQWEGQLVRVELWRHDTSFGGDFDYWKTKVKALSFHPLTAGWVLGVRFEGALASGDPPFWGYPWITLRGIPAMRYQDARVVAAETLAQARRVVGLGA